MSEDDVQRLDAKVEKILKAINGNGEPGLAEQTRANAKAIAAHTKFCDRKNNQRFDVFRIFVGAILSLIVALLVKIILS
jgi:hypothetical protein